MIKVNTKALLITAGVLAILWGAILLCSVVKWFGPLLICLFITSFIGAVIYSAVVEWLATHKE